MSFYREMNSKFGKIYLLATMKYLVWKVTVTHEQLNVVREKTFSSAGGVKSYFYLMVSNLI